MNRFLGMSLYRATRYKLRRTEIEVTMLIQANWTRANGQKGK